MARLPQPGGDDGNWGEILNEYLSESLAADGSVKPGAVSKADVGLGNVDNTSDANKPVSAQAQVVLDQKVAISSLDAMTASRINDSGSQTAVAVSNHVVSEVTDKAAPRIAPMQAYARKVALIAGGANEQLKWCTMLDSIAFSKAEHFLPRIARMLGGWSAVGVGASAPYGGVTINATAGSVTTTTTAFGSWPTGSVDQIPAGASRTWGRGGAAALCTVVKIYYVIAPGAGSFKIQIDGVDASGYTSVDAAGTATLGIATISVARATHTVTVVGLTGTVEIIFPVLEDTGVPGLTVLNVSRGGLGLDQATSNPVALARFGAFLADQGVDVISFEAKESSSYYADALNKLLTQIRTSVPNADFLGIGSTPVSGVSEDADQIVQNAQLRAACATYRGVYWDSYTPVGSYARMVELGWVSDGVHPLAGANRALSGLMVDDLHLLGRTGMPSDSDLAALKARVRDQLTIGSDTVPVLDVVQSVLDVAFRLGRGITFAKADGTAFASFDSRDTQANPSALPRYSQLGPGYAGLVGVDATRVGARQGTNGSGMNTWADLQARALIPTAATAINYSGGTLTLDLNGGSLFTVNLAGNVTNMAFTGGVAGQMILVRFVQDATGGRTITGKGTFDFAGATIPTLTSAANARDQFMFLLMSSRITEFGRAMNVG